jgi:hypothetical protein
MRVFGVVGTRALSSAPSQELQGILEDDLLLIEIECHLSQLVGERENWVAV